MVEVATRYPASARTKPTQLSILRGKGLLEVAVPSTVSIVGLRLWAQSLVLHADGSGDLRLSNVVTEAVADRLLR